MKVKKCNTVKNKITEAEEVMTRSSQSELSVVCNDMRVATQNECACLLWPLYLEQKHETLALILPLCAVNFYGPEKNLPSSLN